MIIQELYNLFKNSSAICTDSRNIISNSIFFALKGESFNGNKFAEEALIKGSKYAIIDEEEYKTDRCILVEDVKECLQELAKYHRKKLNIPVIGITGTNGKTTTKELIHSVLSSQYHCYATKGNLNNQIGLPLSILEINNKHEIAIIEMGASEIGEIKNLSRIAQPSSGIITNVGMAHLEGFGSFEGVIETKTELYRYIKENKGLLFVNADDEILIDKSKGIKKITYGINSNSDFKSSIINMFPFLSLQIGNTSIHSNLIGEFQFYNILATCAIGDFYNINADNLKKSIEAYHPKNNRTEIVETDSNYIILDAYNANPSSMNSIIDSFSKLEKERKLCILGEMRELGEYSNEEHSLLVDKMKDLKIESIFIGQEFLNISSRNTYKNTQEFLQEIGRFNLKDRTILIKGSRGIKLEHLLKSL
tara:strand:- start:6636 stop:7898 length:1263 start_codon:yes stop_codon:yes gene_type:complete